MPFTKIKKGKGRGKYKSPSGKIYTLKQMKAYYATKGWKRKPKKKGNPKKRKTSKLTKTERKRRKRVAKKVLIPKAIAMAGKRGFKATMAKLKGKPGVRSPEKLAGWLKGQAKKRGLLSKKHPYGKKKK